MRIAYINADRGVPVFGTKGSSLHVREVVQAFVRRGAEVHLFAPRFGGDPPPDWGEVAGHALSAGTHVTGANPETDRHRANDELRDALESQPAFDLVYERYSLWSFGAVEYAREKSIPSVLEVNAPLIEEERTYRTLSNLAGAEEAMRRVFGAATKILVVSEALARYVAGRVSDGGKIQIVPNAINPVRFPADVQPTCTNSAGGITVGFVGSLRPWHGLAVLLEAFAQVHRVCPAARLLIVGDGPEREALAENVRQRRLTDAVWMTGAVPAEAVPGYLASIDVAVAPYPNLPNFYFSPLKVYEYMAAGRAVVASNIGQLETLIVHGFNGWHVEPGNANALAEAMLLLSRDPALRRRLGQAARQTIFQNHTWDQVVERIFAMSGIAGQNRALNLTTEPA
jgi:glycosyltransferase involved in cell wall biosynthesis